MESESLRRKDYLKLDANKLDINEAINNGISSTMLDRLTLDSKRIKEISESVRQTSLLPDHVGEVTKMWKRPNGLQIDSNRSSKFNYSCYRNWYWKLPCVC